MKLTDRIYLVGSGSLGMDISDAFDCNVYLIDGGSELALVDGGAGFGTDAILQNVRGDGFDPGRIRHVILTHGHGDHAGGAASLRAALDAPTTYASGFVASCLEVADEEHLSVDVAKKAGIYPPDYRLQSCPIESRIGDGDELHVGDLTIEVLETPGHCDGHLSFVMSYLGKRSLFAGDVVFYGGRVFLQNIYDCRLDALVASLRKLSKVQVDVLLPGHLTISLGNGQRHIEQANLILDRLLIPPQMVAAW